MTEYYLRELDDGCTDVIELVPTVIATFPDWGRAKRFCQQQIAGIACEPPKHEEKRMTSLPALMPTQALTTFVSLIPNDIEPANCRLCDRPFNASVIRDGLCARCRQG